MMPFLLFMLIVLVTKISMQGGIGVLKRHYSHWLMPTLLSGIAPSSKYNIFATNKLLLVMAFGCKMQGAAQIC